MKKYNHILVPLDGSELAELALDDACSLAQCSQAQVTLLQVITPIERIISNADSLIYVDEYLTTQQAMASEYLNEVSQREICQGLTVNFAVEVGMAADTIIDYANRQVVDLIAMATHGHSGLRRWVYGSVADKVLRGAKVPILMVRALPESEAAAVKEHAEDDSIH